MATLKIHGMSCQHCVASTKETLEKIDGISDVDVNLETGEASFQGDIDIQTVRDAITKIGFEVV